MTTTSLTEIEPFTTADGSTIRELLNPRNSPHQNQSLAHATLSAGQKTTRHYHPLTEETYFVMSGRALMEVDGETRELSAGDAVAIPSGAKHQIENVGDGPLEFLCCCAPAYSHDDTILCPGEPKFCN